MKIIFKKNFLYLIFILIFFVTLYAPFQANLFNLDLGDENDNFATGQWINQGKVAYRDFFLQHQPSPTLMSAALQASFDQNTTFLLIKRHREFILIFSFIFITYLTLKFGLAALMAGVFLELSKFTLLGNLFLAESLVIYPVIYLILTVFRLYTSDKKLSNVDLVICSILLGFISLTLAPLNIFVLFIFFLIIFKLEKNNRFKFFKFTLLVGLLYLIVLSKFIFFADYLYQTIYINIFKFIPYESNYHKFSILSVFVLPFQTLFFENTPFYILVKILTIVFFATLLALASLKKWGFVLILYLIVICSNSRPVGFGIFGQGFHYLPYFATIIVLTIQNLIYIPSISKNKIYFLTSSIFTMILIITFTAYGFGEFSKKAVPFDKWYTHYSVSSSYANTIKELSKPSDTLLVMPQESLIYWESGLLASSKYFFTLNIMYSEGFIEEVKLRFAENKPDFWYLANDSAATKAFGEYFPDYVPIRKGKDTSYLMIKKTKLNELTEKNWLSIEKWGFSKPTEI